MKEKGRETHQMCARMPVAPASIVLFINLYTVIQGHELLAVQHGKIQARCLGCFWHLNS